MPFACLIHAYFDVDLDIVWTTVSEDLPPLLPVLESALAELDQVIQQKLAGLNFSRVHRNCLINMDHVAKMAPSAASDGY